MPPSYKKIKPANLHTYDLPGTRDKIGVEASVDQRAVSLYRSALQTADGDRDMAARLLQAAQTLVLIGSTDDEILRHIEETAIQAAQSAVLHKAGVTAEEFAEDPKAAADKLADLLIKGLAKGAAPGMN